MLCVECDNSRCVSACVGVHLCVFCVSTYMLFVCLYVRVCVVSMLGHHDVLWFLTVWCISCISHMFVV